MMRRFELHRHVDVTGMSGVGVVAEGVEFSDGTCTVRWLGERPSTVTWGALADAEHVHGHGGLTAIVFLDRVVPCGAVNSDALGRTWTCGVEAGHAGSCPPPDG